MHIIRVSLNFVEGHLEVLGAVAPKKMYIMRGPKNTIAYMSKGV